MARRADKTDSYISMVLGLNGRVRPADLQSLPPDARFEALQTFTERHQGDTQLHFAGDVLVAGAPPASARAITPDSAAAGVAIAPDPGFTSDAAFTPDAALAPDAEFKPDAERVPAPSAAPLEASPPTDLTADGESALDLLLGDYDGVPPVISAPVLVPPPAPALEGEAAAAYTPTTAPAETTPAVEPASADTAELPDSSRRWLLWWIPTVLLPLLGGATAWFFLRHKRETAARAMLATALVLGLVLSVVWLRYAEQIAAVAEQRAAERVIVLPGK